VTKVEVSEIWGEMDADSDGEEEEFFDSLEIIEETLKITEVEKTNITRQFPVTTTTTTTTTTATTPIPTTNLPKQNINIPSDVIDTYPREPPFVPPPRRYDEDILKRVETISKKVDQLSKYPSIRLTPAYISLIVIFIFGWPLLANRLWIWNKFLPELGKQILKLLLKRDNT